MAGGSYRQHAPPVSLGCRLALVGVWVFGLLRPLSLRVPYFSGAQFRHGRWLGRPRGRGRGTFPFLGSCVR